MKPTNLPLVSIAIISYNCKDFLNEAIISILNQTYQNIEIIIADDCSTDGTQEMLLEYKKCYPQKFILKLNKKNLGITKNSNVAHFACNGKYIAWMGCDDLMLPEKIEKQVELMEKNNDCTICFHNLEVFESDTGKRIRYFNNSKTPYKTSIKEYLSGNIGMGACSCMVRRDQTPEHGFDERLIYASDTHHWAETLMNGGLAYYIDEILGKYRMHKNNITSTSSLQTHLDHLVSTDILLTKHPNLSKHIMKKRSQILQALRRYNNYSTFLLLSLKTNFCLKPLIGLLIYTVSLGKIKK